MKRRIPHGRRHPNPQRERGRFHLHPTPQRRRGEKRGATPFLRNWFRGLLTAGTIARKAKPIGLESRTLGHIEPLEPRQLLAVVGVDFNNLTLGDLAGQDSGAGLGAWTGAATVDLIAGDLVAPPGTNYFVNTGGTPLSVRGPATGSPQVVTSTLDTPLTENEIWFSFLVNPQSTASAGARGGMRLNNLRLLAVESNLRMIGGGGDTAVPGQFTAGQPALVLGRMTVSDTGNDTVEVWVNPDVSQGAAGLGTATGTLIKPLVDSAGVTSISVESYGSNGQGIVDQMVVGDDATEFFSAIDTVNDAPQITNLSINPIAENQTATLTGSFADPDLADNHWVFIDWGDGDSDTMAFTGGERSFTATHQYLQDGNYPITVDVSDSQLHLGLMGLWNFDNDTAADSSGHANDGTFGSGIGFDSVDVPAALSGGKALTGDGTAKITVPNSPTLESLDDQITVAFWMKGTTGDNGNWFRIMRKGTEAEGTQTWMVNRYSNSSDMSVRVDTLGPDGRFNQNIARGGSPAPLDGTWHHVAFTLDNGQWEKYIDGTQVKTGTYKHGYGLRSMRPLEIVGRGGASNLEGLMDDVAIWNRTLGATEIGQVAGAAIPAESHNDMDTVSVVVTDVAPDITSLALTNSSLTEDQTAQLQVNFTDPGTQDPHQVTVDWGDGTQNSYSVPLGQRNPTFSHPYLNDDADDNYDISVTVYDALAYDMAGAWNFDASDAADISGNANTGTVGTVTFSGGDVPDAIGGGQALVTAAASRPNSKITVPNSPTLQALDDQLTVAFWMKATTADNDNWFRILRKTTGATTTPGWMVTRNSSGTDTLIRTDTSGQGNQNQHRGPGSVLDGQWHHVAYVLDNGSTQEFIDGRLVSSGTYVHGDGLSSTEPLLIGGRGAADDYVGLLDDVAVWGRALTSNEVAAIAHRALPVLARDSQSTSITVTNVPPTTPDADRETGENDPLALDLAVVSSDPGTLDDLLYTVTQPSGGSVALVGSTATFDPGTDFDHLAAWQQEVVSFDYTVDDQDGGINTGTVTVTVQGRNDAPTANPDPLYAVDKGNPLDITAAAGVLANDTDPDLSDARAVDSYDTTSTLGANVTVDADGSFTYDPTPIAAYLQTLGAGHSEVDTFGYHLIDAVLYDDFSDADSNGQVDPAKFTVRTDIGTYSAEVKEENGKAKLVQRGHLNTLDEFDPYESPIRITGTWKFENGPDDFMQILTRSDGVPTGTYGETNSGLQFTYRYQTGDFYVTPRGGVASAANNTPTGTLTGIGVGSTVEFEIIDNGTDVSFTLTDAANSSNTITRTATITNPNAVKNHVVFHNREGGGRTALLDNLRITDTAPGDDAATATVTVNGTGDVELDMNLAGLPGGIAGNDTAADDITVRLSSDGTVREIYVGPTRFRSIPATDTTPLVITGSNDSDTLTVDSTYGNPLPNVSSGTPLVFDGGGHTTGSGDTLVIDHGVFGKVIHNMTDGNSGNVDLDGDGSPEITYTGLEPVDMTGSTIDDLVLNLPAGADNAQLTNVSFEIISVNFAVNGDATTSFSALSGVDAGLPGLEVDVDNWNEISLSSTTFAATALVNDDGVATGATIASTVSPGYVGGGGSATTNTPNRVMMNGALYLDNGDTTDTGTITVSNLPSSMTTSGYNVYVYFETNANNRDMTFTITPSSVSGRDGADFAGTFAEATGAGVLSNYAVFSGLTSTGFSIDGTSNPGRAGIAGIQIVSQELRLESTDAIPTFELTDFNPGTYDSVTINGGTGDILTVVDNLMLPAHLTVTVPAIQLNGNVATAGHDQTYNGAVTLGNPVTVTGEDVLLNGTVDNGGNLLTADVTGAASAAAGVISGTGGLIKQGDGTLRLDDQSTFTGGTTVADGTLQLNSGPSNTGTIRGTVDVETGAETLESLKWDSFGFNGPQAISTLNINGGTLTHSAPANLTLGQITINMTGGLLQTTDPAGSLHFLNDQVQVNTLASPDTATIDGKILLRSSQAETTFTVADGSATTDLELTAVISQQDTSGHGIRKEGPGTLVLSSAENTYTGATKVDGGNLTISGFEALDPDSALIVNNGGTLQIDTARVFDAGDPGTSLTINNGGTLIVDDTGTTTRLEVNTLDMTGGTISGTYNAAGSGSGGYWGLFVPQINIHPNATASTIAIGRLAGPKSGGSVTMDVDNGAQANVTGTIRDPQSGTTRLIKSGDGTLTVTSNNTYTGGTTLNAGTLRTNDPSGLGVNGSTVTLVGGTLQLAGGSGDADHVYDLDVTGTASVEATGGRKDLLGDISGAGTLKVIGNSLRIAGDMSGLTGSFVKDNGTGEVHLMIDQGSGTTATSSGSSDAAFTIDAGTVYLLNNNQAGTAYLGALTGTGGTIYAKFARTGDVTLEVGGANTGTNYGGVIANGNTGSTKTSLTKVGSASLTLSGNNSYTGITSITAGTLALSGSGDIDQSAEIAIAGGAFFDVSGTTSGGYSYAHDVTGDGTVTGNLTVTGGGALKPGAASGADPGIVTVNGDVTLVGSFAVQIDGNNAAGAAGGYDQLAVSGANRTVTLGGTLDVSVSSERNGAMTIVNLADTSSSLSGTFAGYAEGAIVAAGTGDGDFVITYRGGDGNDVVLYPAKYWRGAAPQSNIGWQNDLANTGTNQAGSNWFVDAAGSIEGNLAAAGDVAVIHTGNAAANRQDTLQMNGNRTVAGFVVLPAAKFDQGTADLFIVRRGGNSLRTLTITDETAIDFRSDGTETQRTLRFDASGASGSNGDADLLMTSASGAVIDIEGATDTIEISFDITSAPGGITKTGAGTLTLGGANTYPTTTTISGGTLALSGGGEIDESAEIAIATGTFFDVSGTTSGGYSFAHDVTGVGTVTGDLTVASGGALQPGANGGTDPGILTVNGDMTLGGSFAVQIDGNGAAGAAGGFDRLTVSGSGRTVTLGGTLDLTAVNAADGAFTIVELVDAGSTISGTFGGLSEGDLFLAASGESFVITYQGGDGNDVVLHRAKYWRGGDPLTGGAFVGWQATTNWYSDLAGTTTTAVAVAGDYVVLHTTNAPGTENDRQDTIQMNADRQPASILVLPGASFNALLQSATNDLFIIRRGNTVPRTLTLSDEIAIQLQSDGTQTDRILRFDATGGNTANNGPANLVLSNASGATIDVEGATDTVQISFDITSAAGGISKTGAGSLVLNSPRGNPYAGDTTVDDGLLQAVHSGSPMLGTGSLNVANGGTLEVNGFATITPGQQINLTGGTYDSRANNDGTFGNNLAVTANSTMIVQAVDAGNNNKTQTYGTLDFANNNTRLTINSLDGHQVVFSDITGTQQDFYRDGNADVTITGGIGLTGVLRIFFDGGTTTGHGDGHVGSFRVGNAGSTDATFTYDAPGKTLTNTGTFFVGRNGTGTYTFNLEDGAIPITNDLHVADNANSTGILNIRGGSITVNSSNGAAQTDIGNRGTGTLNLTDGTFTANTDLVLGRIGAGSSGTVTVGDGTTAPQLTVTGGNLDVGRAGTGLMTVNSGTVDVTANDLRLAVGANASGTLNLSGGVLDLSGGDVIAGAGTHAFTFAAGRLKDVNVFGRDLPQDGGTLQIGPDGATDGMTVNGNYDLAAAGTLEIEILGSAGAGVAGGHDQLVVNGMVDLGGSPGGVLDLTYDIAAGTGPFVIVNNNLADPVTGRFENPDVPGDALEDGDTISVETGGLKYPLRIEYDFDAGGGGDNNLGNDVALLFDSNVILPATPGDDQVLIRTVDDGTATGVTLIEIYINDPGIDIVNGDLSPSSDLPSNANLFLKVPLSLMSGGSVTWDALAGNDKLAVDYTYAPFVAGAAHLPFDLDFGDDNDQLWLTGGSTTAPDFVSERYSVGTHTPGVGPFSAWQGTLQLTDAAALTQNIQFANLEGPVTDDVPLSDTATVDVTDAADTITLVNTAAKLFPTAVQNTIDPAQTYTNLDFAHKPNVVVNGGDENDQIDVDYIVPAAGLTTMTLNGGANEQTFNLNATTPAGVATSLNGDAHVDQFVYAAGTFVLHGSIDGGSHDDTLSYANYTSVRTIQLAGTGTDDGFQGNDATPGSESILPPVGNGFDNIDLLIGTNLPNQPDTLRGPDLRTHWDLAGDDGVIVADEADLSLTGNASQIGRPTGTVPIAANAPGEEDLAYTSFENLVGGGDDDRFDLRDGAALSGTIDGGDSGLQGDTLDYRDYTTTVDVDLTDGSATNIFGGAAAGLVDALDVDTTGDDVADTTSSSIENVFGGDDDDDITGDVDNNILGDGHGSDTLRGGRGDDRYLLEPSGASADTLFETANDPAWTQTFAGDTVDFSRAAQPPQPAAPPAATLPVGESWGIKVDMDDPLAATQPLYYYRTTDPGPDNVVTDAGGPTLILERELPADDPADPSPFENVVGSTYNDLIDIDPLGSVIRDVDGNDGWESITFDGGGSEVIDTGRSLTATGIGSIGHNNIEWIEVANNAPRVIDNDDPGYGQAGNWGRTVVEGFLGDERYALAGMGSNVASWTFSGVVPGWYRVAATWTEGANRITDAQFEVYNVDAAGAATVPTAVQADGTANTGIDTLSQQIAPNDFSDSGAAWEELKDGSPLLFYIPDHEVRVQLSDLSAATNRRFAMADAVRIERINGMDDPPHGIALEPEIRILAGTTNSSAAELIDGFGVQDFGSIAADAVDPAARTFTVENTGLAPLNLTITDVPGDGFTITPVGPLSIAAGDPPIELTIALDPSDTTETGRLFTTLSLDTNDRDENPFEIAVTGFIETALPVDAAETLDAVDNDDNPLTFDVLSGDWRYIRRDTRFVDYDYRYAVGGDQTVEWRLNTGLTGTHLVDVAATWAGGMNRATNATYTVKDSTGAILLTKQINQNLAPDDFESGGTMWEVLGTVTMGNGSALTVELTTFGADGYVLADSVWVGTSTTPTLVVSGDGRELVNNQSVIDFGYVELNPNVAEERVITVESIAGVGVDVYLPPTLPAGFTLVEATETLDLLDGVLDDKVALTEVDATLPSFQFTVRVDAQAPGNVGGPVTMMNEATDPDPFQFAVAAQVGVQVVDNGDQPGFDLSETASNFRNYADPTAFQGDVHYHAKGTGANYVDYSFTGLTLGQYYRVATTWTTGSSRTSYTEYQMYDLARTAISPIELPDATASADQRSAPDDFYYEGEAWENLGIVQLNASTNLTVRLTDKGDNWIYADAVRIEQVYLPTAEVTIGGEFYQSGQPLDFGDVLEQPGQTEAASQVVTIRNLGALPLELGEPAWLGSSNITLDTSAWTTDPLTVPPGESVTFTISLPNTADIYSGTLRFTSNDVTSPQFDLPVSGRVAGNVVVDESDGDGGITGDFPRVARDTRAYNLDYRFSRKGSGSDSLRWGTVSGLVDDQVYTVSASWPKGSTQATNAPFTITSGENSVTVGVNQRVTADDFYDGRWWETLTAIEADGTSLTVTLTDAANGTVVADAIRVDVPNVAKTTPTITWADPAAIINPAPLTSTQLNATADAPGSLLYTPAAGTVLPVGMDQTLTTLFTPNDPTTVNPTAATATIDVLAALRAAGAERSSAAAGELSPDSAAALLPAAILWWESEGLTAADAARLAEIRLVVTSLPGNVLGASAPGSSQIWLDTNAAGYGWNVDALPTDDSEINRQSAIGNWQSIDLLSVLAHELGHVIGRDHDDAHDVMAATLEPGGLVASYQLSVISDQSSVISDQSSVISDLWSDGMATQAAFRTPTSNVDNTSTSRIPTSAFDNVFARLDERSGSLTDAVLDDEPDDEQDREGESNEDALDLWSVLYGLG